MAGEFTTVNNPNVETTYINKRFMDDLLLAVQMVQFCTPPDSQGMHVGDTARWLHFPEWTVDKTALSQTDPADNQVSISGTLGAENVDSALNPYGAYVEAANFALDTAPVGTLDKISKRAADAGARALDELAYDAAATTTIAHYAGQTSVTTSGTATTAVAADFSACNAYFATQGAHGFDHLGGQFGGVLHPNAAGHIMSQAGTTADNVTWAKVNKEVAGKQEKIERGEMGSLFNVRLFSSPVCATQAYGYDNIVLAKDGIGCSTIDEGNETKAKVIVKKPGPGDTSQPLDTYQTIGWKWVGTFALLDANRVIKYISAL